MSGISLVGILHPKCASSISHLSQVANNASRIAKRLREREMACVPCPPWPPLEVRVPISGSRAIPTGTPVWTQTSRSSVGRATDAQRPVSRPAQRRGTHRNALYVRLSPLCPPIPPHPPPSFPFRASSIPRDRIRKRPGEGSPEYQNEPVGCSRGLSRLHTTIDSPAPA